MKSMSRKTSIATALLFDLMQLEFAIAQRPVDSMQTGFGCVQSAFVVT